MESDHDNSELSQHALWLADWLAHSSVAKFEKTIELTQPEFIRFQMRLRVVSVAHVVLLPTDSGRAAEIVYLGKNREARYKFVAIDPSSFKTGKFRELRNIDPRLSAPREVRHHPRDEKQPDSLRGHADTVRCFACLLDPSALSPLEQSIACRYIHAGEFAYLCLLWLWTGEPKDRRVIQVSDVRGVTLEQLSDTRGGQGPLLLGKLCDLGLEDKLRQLYGGLHGLQQGDGCWTRSTSREKDFEALGFITPTGGGSQQLTEKARLFTKWLGEAVRFLVGAQHETASSPHNIKRLHRLLNPSAKKGWLDTLVHHAEKLQSTSERNDSVAWAEALNSFLNDFISQIEREDFREILRTDGFPVYPLVHMTMLFGIESPVDWLAVPLGSMMHDGNSEGTSQYWPQAAAFVLASHRAPREVNELVAAIRPILATVAFVESSPWIQRVLRQKEEQLENLYASMPDVIDGLFAKSPAMKRAIAEARRFAPSDKTILLLGETGTGKTMLARYVKHRSQRSDGPFEEHSIHAFAPGLVESELFGHEKGAFPDAHTQQKGIIERAHGGTLFLDEIQDLEPRLQTKLLKAIEDRWFYRCGGEKRVDSDFRLIVAGSADLPERVAKGQFNRALWGRINKVPVVLPPLRERREEIIPLSKFLYAKARQMAHGSPSEPKLDDEIIKLLESHNWPENVRELQGVMEYAAEIADDNVVNRELLRSKLALFAALPTESSIVSAVEVEKYAAMFDPPLRQSMVAISDTLHPRNTSQARHWRRHPNCNALAILAARLRRKQPKPTWNELAKGTGVSEPVLRDMVDRGEKLLAEVPTGRQVQ